jgi:hypothetical protein
MSNEKKKGLRPGDPGYWEWRKNTGRKKILKTPEHLWRVACDYFESVDSKPFLKNEAIKSGDLAGTTMVVETIRPYTWEGLDDYLFEQGIGVTLDEYRHNKRGAYEEYSPIIARIHKIIRNRNLEGAAVGALKENIIARYHELGDKQAVTIKEEQPLFGDEHEDK